MYGSFSRERPIVLLREGEKSGPWRTAWEFAEKLAEASQLAKVIGRWQKLGYSARSIYSMGFVDRGYPFKIRVGTKKPEYPLAVQLDAMFRAVDYFSRNIPEELKDQWKREAGRLLKI